MDSGSKVTAVPLSAQLLQPTGACWRAANYLAARQIYVCSNPLMAKPRNFSLSSLGCSATGRDKPIEYGAYVREYGEDLPEVGDGKWAGNARPQTRLRHRADLGCATCPSNFL